MRYLVHADQRQFSLRDKDAWRPGDGGWTEEAVDRWRVAVEPSSLSVATARSDWVETDLTVGAGAPPPLADASHIVEADLDLPGGEATLAGPADYAGHEHRIAVPPGRYRVRVSYVESGPPDADWHDHEYGAHFRYVLDLWPVSAASPVAVVRQGAAVWDG